MRALVVVSDSVDSAWSVDERYRRFVDALDCAWRGKRLRILGYEKFTQRFSDLSVWMHRPTPARLDDVSRTDAWPFISWCFATGLVHPDVDLLATRSKGGHFTTWAGLHAPETNRAVQAGTDLGWAATWTHQVCVSALAFMSMTTGETIDTFTDQSFDSISEEVRAAPHVTACHRKELDGRLHALRQVCFQLGTLDRAPVNRNIRVHSIDSHAAAIPQPEIRATAQRYLPRDRDHASPVNSRGPRREPGTIRHLAQRASPEDHNYRST